MEKRVFLIASRICNRRKHIKSRVFFKHAIGTEWFPVHDMTANNAVRGRKLDIGIIRKTDFVIDKNRDDTVNKETQEKGYCNNSSLPQVSQWRKPASHMHPLANKTARILRECRNGVLQFFD